MVYALDNDEFQQLVFDMGIIDLDNIEGDTLNGRVRHFLNYCDRHGYIEPLIQELQRRRPHIAWPAL